ncbi:TPA: hypothetical protein QDA74_003722 [Burkholderia territorii]|uniref:hypothetical protein n=1 Tax=Burkholderia territorii TaxID=1503055 RepID=UPI0011C92CCD|nr:hypothetical protein [Burkholderia territorii]TXG07057.1 hypothetical protein FU139_25435 [Burkholderia territorii]HDR8859224.1 hypothetical protein [Burkholderia territorii]HDR8866209.1 hypothetical protein [Burkholderia territorii]HDR8872313.1 hypothetical protein [Burkholderia territorii]HDR8878211.1 hypothetical protein [Burkholderia territorii]
MNTFIVEVRAASPSWQSSEVSLAPGESAEITATGSWGVIDPAQRGNCGPGGNGVTSHGTFMGASIGAPEGCLLVRDGSANILAFTPTQERITVHVPGLITFVANDDPTPPQGWGFQGFGDNTGSLEVTIKVTQG